jgi:putative oxidoreductase
MLRAAPRASPPGRYFMRQSIALEFVGGLLVLIGLLTRPPLHLVRHEGCRLFMAHAPRGFFPIVNQGEPAILISFIFLLLAAAGPGAWSVVGWRRQGNLQR